MSAAKESIELPASDPEEAREVPATANDLHGDPEMVESGPEGVEELPNNWRAAKSLLKLRDQVKAMAPRRSKTSDGMVGDHAHWLKGKATDHNPWIEEGGDVGVVTAFDITHDPRNGCDAKAIAETLVAKREPRVKYVIWNRRICASYPVGGKNAWEWRPYGGSNPHDKHVHISVKSDKASYDSEADWPLPGE